MHPRTALVALLTAVLVGCTGGGGGAGPMDWRDLDLVVPTGWQVLEQRDDVLTIANEDLRADEDEGTPTVPDDPDTNDVVAVQFTTDGTNAESWRDFVRSEGGEVESDQRIQVDGVPATAITFTWSTSSGVPTREQVVIVPSRDLVVLLQPVPVQGQQTGPDVYLDHVEEFQAILDSIDFGAPEDA